MKKALNFFIFFALANLGTLTGRVLHVYSDSRANPWKYTPPYKTFQEALSPDFIVFGSALVISVIAAIVLKVIISKRKKQGSQEEKEA